MRSWLSSNNRSVTHDFKDAPNTTSATTYTLYCRNNGSGMYLSVNWNNSYCYDGLGDCTMSTLFVNNLNTASGSTITIPSGKTLCTN